MQTHYRKIMLPAGLVLCVLLTLPAGCSYNKEPITEDEYILTDDEMLYNPVYPTTLCPDGTTVEGIKCFEMPDGTYEGS